MAMAELEAATAGHIHDEVQRAVFAALKGEQARLGSLTEGHPNCPIPPEAPQYPRFDAWYDWICNSQCRNVVTTDAAAAVGAAVYNWVAGPAGAASTIALTAAGSASQAVLELLAILQT